MSELDDLEEINFAPSNNGGSAKQIRQGRKYCLEAVERRREKPQWVKQVRHGKRNDKSRITLPGQEPKQ